MIGLDTEVLKPKKQVRRHPLEGFTLTQILAAQPLKCYDVSHVESDGGLLEHAERREGSRPRLGG
jgi:hypothetical protein